MEKGLEEPIRARGGASNELNPCLSLHFHARSVWPGDSQARYAPSVVTGTT
jgi:hypothetical protein